MRCTIRAWHQPDAALRAELERALQRAQEFNLVGYAMYIYKALAFLELALGNKNQAEQEVQHGLGIAQQIHAEHLQGELLTILAQIALDQGESGRAAWLLEQALPLVRAGNSQDELATTLAAWGEVQLHLQHFEEADSTFQCVLHTAPQEHKLLCALAHYGLARAAVGQGDVSQALQRGEQALQVFASLHHIQTPEVRAWLQAMRRQLPHELHEILDQHHEQGIVTTASLLFEQQESRSPEGPGPHSSASA